jgi:hypothetical protein
VTNLQLIMLASDNRGGVFLLPRSSLVMPRSSRVHRADAHGRQGS